MGARKRIGSVPAGVPLWWIQTILCTAWWFISEKPKTPDPDPFGRAEPPLGRQGEGARLRVNPEPPGL